MTARTVVVTLLLTVCFPVLAAEKNDGTTLTEVGQMAPEVGFTTLDGKEVKLADLKGKVVYLHFFATWCGACIKELPAVNKEIWERFGSDPNFVFLVVGREQERDVLEDFRDQHGYKFPIAPDPGRKMYLHYATRWIPRHYLIDSDGKIIDQNVGEEASERAKMVSMIEDRLKALSEKS